MKRIFTENEIINFKREVEKAVKKAVKKEGNKDKFYATPQQASKVFKEYSGYTNKDYNNEVKTDWSVTSANRKLFNGLTPDQKRVLLSYCWAVYNRNGEDILNTLLNNIPGDRDTFPQVYILARNQTEIKRFQADSDRDALVKAIHKYGAPGGVWKLVWQWGEKRIRELDDYKNKAVWRVIPIKFEKSAKLNGSW